MFSRKNPSTQFTRSKTLPARYSSTAGQSKPAQLTRSSSMMAPRPGIGRRNAQLTRSSSMMAPRPGIGRRNAQLTRSSSMMASQPGIGRRNAQLTRSSSMMASQPGIGRRNAQLTRSSSMMAPRLGIGRRNAQLTRPPKRRGFMNGMFGKSTNTRQNVRTLQTLQTNGRQIRNNPLYNQNVPQRTGASDAVIAELKQRFASRGNKPMLEAVGRLAPGLVPVPYQRGIRNFDQTKQILVNAMGRPFIVFIPAQMREQNKEILSDDRLRPSLLDMRFVRKSQSPGMAVFGDGYYNTKFFGTAPTPTPVISTAEINARCNEIRDRIARLTAELEQNGCV